MQVILQRERSTDQGTFGKLTLEKGWSCVTIELPWRDNKRQRSCIPAGTYECSMTNSPKFGRVYTVKNVRGRSHILFHAGNYAGDVEKGFRSDVEGCILVGSAKGTLNNQQVVVNSRNTLRKFHEELGSKDFTLIVNENL